MSASWLAIMKFCSNGEISATVLSREKQLWENKMVASKKQEAVMIELPKLNLKIMIITLIGDTPLIVHKWSEKAIKEMLNKQMKVATNGKAKKDPEADYHSSLYTMPDGGYGFPSVGFKNAAVTACTSLAGITKVAARQAFRVIGEVTPIKTVFNGSEMRMNLVKIDGHEGPEMREDMVRLNGGVADIRYRGQFWPWSCSLKILFNENVLSREQVMNMFNTAGFAVGVGEWRQEKNGEYGAFHVGDTAELSGNTERVS
jgi:hypothetical protein